MKWVILVLMHLPVILFAQESQGIKFEDNLNNWQQVLEKAKAENKYIFLDCYTTWCVPCKVMEKNVYSTKKVGDFYNDRFLSVKIQIDRTDKDNNHVKGWYGDAEFIEKNFGVNAFPTYLFLSPSGKPLHKESGALDPDKFIQLGKNALDSQKQYYRILADFKPGEMDTSEMKGIARALKFSGPELAKKIVVDYLERTPTQLLFTDDNVKLLREFKEIEKVQEIATKYIKSLPKEKLFLKPNIEFIAEFAQKTNSVAFKIFYENVDRINKLMWDNDYSQNIIVSAIASEEFFVPIGLPGRDKFKNSNVAEEPNWNKIASKIADKYNTYYSKRIILDAQVWWYSITKNWKKYSATSMKRMDEVYSKKDLNDGGVCWNLNNDCWYIFQRAADTLILKRAVYWMEESFKHNLLGATFYTYMDTYANLLYKLGNKEMALIWEERAVKLNPLDQEIGENFNKMKKGEPTWPVELNKAISSK